MKKAKVKTAIDQFFEAMDAQDTAEMERLIADDDEVLACFKSHNLCYRSYR